MLYMVTFTINIPPMLAYIPYMDPMGYTVSSHRGDRRDRRRRGAGKTPGHTAISQAHVASTDGQALLMGK